MWKKITAFTNFAEVVLTWKILQNFYLRYREINSSVTKLLYMNDINVNGENVIIIAFTTLLKLIVCWLSHVVCFWGFSRSKKNSICILVPECVSCARPVFHTPFVSGRPADCGGQYWAALSQQNTEYQQTRSRQ